MTALEIIRQWQDDGIMTEERAVEMIESYANTRALQIAEKAVKEAKKSIQSGEWDYRSMSIPDAILSRIKQLTGGK